MQPAVRPKLDASERAARDLLNRKVREGIIDRRNANEILRTGLPFVRTMIAQWRREGTDPQWLTGKFKAMHTEALQKQATATNPVALRLALTRVLCAEMYLAVWAGLQVDLAAHVNEHRVQPGELPA